MPEIFDLKSQRTVIFITGAGRGYGSACALSAAKMFHNDSLLLLCGRNLESLQGTVAKIRQINEIIKVETFVLDLETVEDEEIKSILNRVLPVETNKFECFVLIHNAATVGDTTKFAYELRDKCAIESYLSTNLTGTIVANNALLEHSKRVLEVTGLILVVNVSSLAAVKPFESCSLYCATKAAREMFFNCLNLEWARHEPSRLFVVNYAPGPMYTDMMMTLLHDGAHSTFVQGLQHIMDTGQMLDPFTSSEKLFGKILNNYRNFESGCRIDFYDL